jgi:hypothetical protein
MVLRRALGMMTFLLMEETFGNSCFVADDLKGDIWTFKPVL